ncbi:cell division protein [Verrucomicrobia bacterium LW23]|nr:cell division protein [Verrucomicrobia bacterium LW23]
MPVLTLESTIRAPVERVFDLTRSIDLHMRSAEATGERAIGGVTRGLIGMGQEVTWRARHFGVWQTLTARITAFSRPEHFRDSMVRGVFARFDHDHYFRSVSNDLTFVREIFDYNSPFGLLGTAVDALLLKNYMRNFLARRNEIIREVAEGEEWKKYVE